MGTLHFHGRIFPECMHITLAGVPTTNWKNTDLSLSGKFLLYIQDSTVKVTFESDAEAFTKDEIAQIYFRAFDFATALTNVLTYSRAQGLTIIISKFQLDDGPLDDIYASDDRFAGLAKSVQDPQALAKIMKVVTDDRGLFLAMRDLTDSLRYHDYGYINCARAIESLRQHFAKPGDKRDAAWAAMHESLNLTKAYIKPITDASRGPRHGERIRNNDTSEMRDIGTRSWIIMDRFLEYRVRGDQPLPEDEFPVLDD